MPKLLNRIVEGPGGLFVGQMKVPTCISFITTSFQAAISNSAPCQSCAGSTTMPLPTELVTARACRWLGKHRVAEFEIAASNEVVIYEMHVGCTRPTKRPPDSTMRSRTWRLKQLQVNVVGGPGHGVRRGSMPWGYNPAHIFAVESAYGGPEGFKAFIEAAHRSGIAVILDVVYNSAQATST